VVEGCPFCALATGIDALVFTIRDANPVSPGHTLVIPRRHFESIGDATEDEERAFLGELRATRRALRALLAPDGFNVGVNDGAAAGQTVPHAHVHVIPRFLGDVSDPRGGVRHCVVGKGFYPPEPP